MSHMFLPYLLYWNIVETGVKHHKPNKTIVLYMNNVYERHVNNWSNMYLWLLHYKVIIFLICCFTYDLLFYNVVRENPCNSSPCSNGGTCQRLTADTYQCQCTPGYTGTLCEGKIYSNNLQKSLKIPKWQSESVNWRRTEPTMAKWRKNKRTNNDLRNIHINLKIE